MHRQILIINIRNIFKHALNVHGNLKRDVSHYKNGQDFCHQSYIENFQR